MDPDPDIELYLTAGEAFPALERAFLTARSEILAGFRIFDLTTRLRSDEAREIGETWFDLIAHTLSRGVAVTFTLSDFDPVVRPELHRGSWRSHRMFLAAAEHSDHPDLLTVRVAMHPATVGWLPRLALWPKTYGLLKDIARDLNALGADKRQTHLENMPGLAPLLKRSDAGVTAKAWPPAQLIPATHHQKLAVFDSAAVYIGGLDLDERRYDTPEHERMAEETWHDAHMMVRRVDLAASARQHLLSFWKDDATTIAEMPSGGFLRTLSAPRKFNLLSMSPRQEITEIANAHMTEAAKATRLIYLETQFFRDRRLAEKLAQAARENPDLSLILILPAAPEDVAFENTQSSDKRYGEYLQAKCVAILRAAFGARLFIGAPARPTSETRHDPGRAALAGAPIVYVHAKVSVFDETAAVISSANLNGRSHYWDTEAGVLIRDPHAVRGIRRQCMAHWLPEDTGAEYFEVETATQAWAALADENEGAAPHERRGFLLPYPDAPARRFGKNLPGVPEEMV
jgi:phospholipase D1/2